MNKRKLAPVHPGEILLMEFIEPLGLAQAALARALGIPAMRVSEIVRGRRAVTADTALRLSRYFGTKPAWWLNLQAHYDLQVALDKLEARALSRIEPCPFMATT